MPWLLTAEGLTPEYRWHLVESLYGHRRSLVQGWVTLGAVQAACLGFTHYAGFAVLLVLSSLLILLRLAMARALRAASRAAATGGAAPEIWARRFALGSAGAGLLWGTTSFSVFTQSDDANLRLFVVIVQAAWLTTAGVRVAASPAAAAALGIFSLGPTMAGTVLGVAGPERYLGFLWVVNLTAALGIARYVGQMLCKLMLSEKRLAEANAHLTELSATDSLTGIGNRRAFDAALRAEWGRALRDGTDLGVLVMDVDHFKAFNDAYGHPAGDDCLRRIAAILLRAMRRPTDMSARYGGEEFVALMPGTDGPGAQAAAERTRQAIWDGALPHEGSSFGRVSVSVGAASLSPLPGDDPQALIDLADRALYAAKLAGRNRVVLADGSEASPGSSAPWVGARVAAWPFLAPDPPANGWPRSRL